MQDIGFYRRTRLDHQLAVTPWKFLQQQLTANAAAGRFHPSVNGVFLEVLARQLDGPFPRMPERISAAQSTLLQWTVNRCMHDTYDGVDRQLP